MQEIAAALRRAQAILLRRPGAGVHDDAPATASWRGGTRVVARHAGGREFETDIDCEFGGSGDRPSPGWLLRAGLAACTATLVAMRAAQAGIALDLLEVVATSRSDARALIGMTETDGVRIDPRPRGIRLHVRIGAAGVAYERLRELVERAHAASPVARTIEDGVAIALHVEVAA